MQTSSGTHPDQRSDEDLHRTLDHRIADHLEPLLARMGELERRLGQETRGATKSIEERLSELERLERHRAEHSH